MGHSWTKWSRQSPISGCGRYDDLDVGCLGGVCWRELAAAVDTIRQDVLRVSQYFDVYYPS